MKAGSSSRPTLHHASLGTIGLLQHKRLFVQNSDERHQDLDWALCSIERNKLQLGNAVLLPDGSILSPRSISQNDPTDTVVWANTGSGVVRGFVMGDYSLVALPGSKSFQRMWMVVLDRVVGEYFCATFTRVPVRG